MPLKYETQFCVWKIPYILCLAYLCLNMTTYCEITFKYLETESVASFILSGICKIMHFAVGPCCVAAYPPLAPCGSAGRRAWGGLGRTEGRPRKLGRQGRECAGQTYKSQMKIGGLHGSYGPALYNLIGSQRRMKQVYKLSCFLAEGG